ncbi:GAF domain-containing protein [Candidatus Nomurabacteria bacterium]|nr:GAF domain-containing protein [Candidatus Nomurabacteria bacterium]
MKEAPIPENEKKRLASLYKLGLLDTKPEDRFDNITETATKIFNIPISTLTLVDAKREWFKSCIGLPVREGDRAISFCGHALLANNVFVIPDTKKDKRFKDNPMVVGKPFIRFYAGVPIMSADQNRIGVFCVKDTKPRKFSKNDKEILKNLASWAELEINSRNLRLALSEQKKLQKKIIQNYKSLEESKAKDEAILESIGDGLIAVDNERKIMLINKVASNLIGLNTQDILGKVITEFRLEDEKGNLIPLDKRPTTISLKTGEVTRVVYYYVKEDKNKFPMAITATPIKLNGKTIGLIEIIRDVTKEKEIDKAKSEFVSIAAHQLRTPLTTVSWYTEMLLSGDVDIKNQKKYLEEIYKGNKTMIDLVDTLLNVSRLELGTLKMKPGPVNIKDITDSVLEELEPKILEKKIIFEKKYNQQNPLIFADSKLFRIILQNLLGNAVKYVKTEGNVSLDISSQEKNTLIKISNNGIGIPKEAQPKIFSKLFRDDLAKEREPDGNGLGLYIVKSIVESSGGKVWFESDQDNTVFYVLLPTDGFKMVEK